MPEVELQHGNFCWVDLMAHDMSAAESFYGDLFGWSFVDAPSDPAHPYRMVMQGEYVICGMGQMSAEMKEGGIPQAWNSYIKVDDLDEVAGRVVELGGSIMMPPMDAQEAGRMAIVQDPSGAVVSLWQEKNPPGRMLFNEPNSLSWNELLTRDPAAARTFFTELLGWGWEEMDMGEMGMYYVGTVGDRPNGGVMMMPAEVPEFVPAHWDVYFAVEDVDASAAKAEELGATLMVPPTDISVGRFAYICDPQGGHFTVFKSSTPPE